LGGVPPGTIRRLRVIALDFRPAAVGTNHNRGEGGNARVCTPVSISGAWDVKRVLGNATVYADGSAAFKAPARTALYFQALNEKGYAVQSMRSWATLMPGETYSCIGCHDNKNASATTGKRRSMALAAGPQELAPFFGPARGFSFLSEVQPIFDEHCVSCHDGPVYTAGHEGRAFSLLRRPVRDGQAKRMWSESYLSLLQAMEPEGKNRIRKYTQSNAFINWLSPQGGPEVRKPFSFGANTSPMMADLEHGHPDVAGERRVELSREALEKIACWIDLAVPFVGDYCEAGAWSDEESAWYRHQVLKQERLRALEWKRIP
jgi:hypothetical protein